MGKKASIVEEVSSADEFDGEFSSDDDAPEVINQSKSKKNFEPVAKKQKKIAKKPKKLANAMMIRGADIFAQELPE